MMKLRMIIYCIIIIVITACNDQETVEKATIDTSGNADEFYHYSIWTALVNKVYDGNLTVQEGKKKGDIGLGTYNGADGELIMLDGTMYHVPSSGEVKIAPDTLRIPYLNATFFNKEFSFEFNDRLNYDTLRKLVQKQFPSRNFFYAFRIHAELDSLKLGSLYKQEKPYQEGLDSLMPKRPVFNKTNVSGTMVGFFCPDFMGDINVAGFHLHFISDDKQTGGHVMEFTGKNFRVEMDKLTSYRFVLPDTEDYRQVNLEKKFQYGKK
jgi:acetolactate decarboxylase